MGHLQSYLIFLFIRVVKYHRHLLLSLNKRTLKRVLLINFLLVFLTSERLVLTCLSRARQTVAKNLLLHFTTHLFLTFKSFLIAGSKCLFKCLFIIVYHFKIVLKLSIFYFFLHVLVKCLIQLKPLARQRKRQLFIISAIIRQIIWVVT